MSRIYNPHKTEQDLAVLLMDAMEQHRRHERVRVERTLCQALTLLRVCGTDPAITLRYLAAYPTCARHTLDAIIRDLGGRRFRRQLPRPRRWWEFLPRILLRPLRRFVPTQFHGG